MANSVTVPLQGGYPHHVANVLGLLTSAQLSTAYSGSTVKTATKDFSMPYKGHVVGFNRGQPVVCDAAMVAALAAAGAPVV